MIAPVSSRLIVNQASMKTRHADIQLIIDQLAQAVAARREPADAAVGEVTEKAKGTGA